MKKLAYVITVAAFCLAPFAAQADGQHSHHPITISNASARILLQNRPGSVYMQVHNSGDAADKLISASSPLAKRVEIHTHLMTDGVMRMRPVAGGVNVAAHGDVEFKSGGLHLMVFGLKSKLKMGEALPITVVFEKAGAIDFNAPLQSMKTMKPGKHSGHMMKDKMKHKTQ